MQRNTIIFILLIRFIIIFVSYLSAGNENDWFVPHVYTVLILFELLNYNNVELVVLHTYTSNNMAKHSHEMCIVPLFRTYPYCKNIKVPSVHQVFCLYYMKKTPHVCLGLDHGYAGQLRLHLVFIHVKMTMLNKRHVLKQTYDCINLYWYFSNKMMSFVSDHENKQITWPLLCTCTTNIDTIYIEYI